MNKCTDRNFLTKSCCYKRI